MPTVAGYLDKNLFNHSLPHEFTHLVSKELLGVTRMPLWLDEGLATYEEGIPLRGVKYFLREKIKNKNYIKLSELIVIKEYPSDKDRVRLFYLESQSFVSFLLDTNKKAFPSFLRWYATKRHSFQKAYLYSYGETSKIKNIEKKWIDYIMKD